MNMKKTIAALAACAVATSAMATTVAAEGSVQYNLVHTTYKLTPGTVTHRAVISAEWNGEAYLNVLFKVPAAELNNENMKWSINAYGINGAGNKMDPLKFNNYVAAGVTWAANSSQWINLNWEGDNKNAAGEAIKGDEFQILSIPLDKTGLNIVNTDAVGIYVDLSVTVEHEQKDSWNYTGLKDAEIGYFVSNSASVSDDLWGLNTSWNYNYTTYVDPALAAANVDVADIATGDTLGLEYLFQYVCTKVDVTESNKTEAKTELDKKYPMLTNIVTNTASLTNTNSYAKQGAYDQTVDGGMIYWADDYGCVLKNVHGSASNILDYLSRPSFNLIEEGKSYVNVIPVINDILVNYDDVTFTFNTAAEAVGKDYDDANKNGKFDLGETLYGYNYGGADKDEQYTKFNQHLYNFYGDEGTTYVYSDAYDWSNYNLFNGALVINGQLSMSLQDTNVFDYGMSSLSFNWAEATEGATVNSYAKYLTKMQLATSTMWFWDNLVVSFANTEVEDVASDAGAEAEEDIIEEEVIEEEIIEEEVIEEEVIEEEPVVEEPVVEEPAPAPAPAPAPNPSTGNAPIALAVVPVALAAAAVVAKKRG